MKLLCESWKCIDLSLLFLMNSDIIQISGFMRTIELCAYCLLCCSFDTTYHKYRLYIFVSQPFCDVFTTALLSTMEAASLPGASAVH